MDIITLPPALPEISKALWRLLETTDIVYLQWQPDLTDFRVSRQVMLKVMTNTQGILIPIPRQHLMSFFGLLKASIFSASKIVIAWNIKQLFSFFRYHLPPHFRQNISCKLIDLKLTEAFINTPFDAPPTYEEAVRRTGLLMGNKDVVRVNNEIYVPLSTEILPAIETHGLVNQTQGVIMYSSYNIEGSQNGRLSCTQVFDGCFLPHSMTAQDKSQFSAGHEKKFVVLDYKSMEVSVLQWLSGDERLGRIIESGEDVYLGIGKLVGIRNRKFIKSTFLSVIFGAGAARIAEMGNLPLAGAEALIAVYRKTFPTAFHWMKIHYDAVLDGAPVKDRIGRVFGDDRDPWKVRNAIVQGPAATICLDKLIHLYKNRPEALEIAATVHDGYVCAVPEQSLDNVAMTAKELLEEPSSFAPEMKLSVEVRVGSNWGDLKSWNINE